MAAVLKTPVMYSHITAAFTGTCYEHELETNCSDLWFDYSALAKD